MGTLPGEDRGCKILLLSFRLSRFCAQTWEGIIVALDRLSGQLKSNSHGLLPATLLLHLLHRLIYTSTSIADEG